MPSLLMYPGCGTIIPPRIPRCQPKLAAIPPNREEWRPANPTFERCPGRRFPR